MPKLPRIKSCPKAFSPQAKAFNEAMALLEGLLNFTSKDGTVKITITDGNTDLSVNINLTSTDNSVSISPIAGGYDLSVPPGLPSGSTGDMLYHDGSGWVALAAPTVSDSDPVLRHDGTAPYWEEPEDCDE